MWMIAAIDWTMLSALATALSALAVAITGIFVFFQLHSLRRGQEVEVALTLYDRSSSPELLEAASWVKTGMPADFNYKDFQSTPEARQNLERLWYYFEFVGVLVDRGYVSKHLIFDQQGAFIAGIWDKSESLIQARRKDRRSPQYMENFEILRDEFEIWAKKVRPKLSPDEVRQSQRYYDGESRPRVASSPRPT
jgi:hypothetical protein